MLIETTLTPTKTLIHRLSRYENQGKQLQLHPKPFPGTAEPMQTDPYPSEPLVTDSSDKKPYPLVRPSTSSASTENIQINEVSSSDEVFRNRAAENALAKLLRSAPKPPAPSPGPPGTPTATPGVPVAPGAALLSNKSPRTRSEKRPPGNQSDEENDEMNLGAGVLGAGDGSRLSLEPLRKRGRQRGGPSAVSLPLPLPERNLRERNVISSLISTSSSADFRMKLRHSGVGRGATRCSSASPKKGTTLRIKPKPKPRGKRK